jgi:ribosomal protein S18 acetylase RimI-like enzyme
MDLKTRNAKPDDAPFLAWLILTAGRSHVKRGIWEVILNLSERDCLRFLELLAITTIPHLFHYSCFLLAEVESKPVGGLAGFDPDILGYPRLMEALPEVYGKLGKPATGGLPKIIDSIPPYVKGSWVIESVATVPEFRRRGIVDRLLDEILDLGRKRVYRQAQLAIYMGNTPAQRAYEKHGFRLLDEWPDLYFEKEIGAPVWPV